MYSLSISYRNSPEFHLNLLNAKVFCCFKDALKVAHKKLWHAFLGKFKSYESANEIQKTSLFILFLARSGYGTLL